MRRAAVPGLRGEECNSEVADGFSAAATAAVDESVRNGPVWLVISGASEALRLILTIVAEQGNLPRLSPVRITSRNGKERLLSGTPQSYWKINTCQNSRVPVNIFCSPSGGTKVELRVSETRNWVDVSVSSSIQGSNRFQEPAGGAAVVLCHGKFSEPFLLPETLRAEPQPLVSPRRPDVFRSCTLAVRKLWQLR